MKMAKASEADMEAMFALTRLLNAVDSEQFPPLPNGEWQEGDPDWFDPADKEHLEQFHHRLMECIAPYPGSWNRVIWGFHIAMTNGVFDPAADCLEWHPALRAAVEARNAKAGVTAAELPFFTNHTPPAR